MPENLKLNTFLQEFHSDCPHSECNFGFYGFVDDFINLKKGKPFENNFIDKKTSLELFEKLFSKLKKYKYWILSYNNSSYPDKEALINLIKKFVKNVKIIEKKHNYQITGKDTKTKNKEYLFIVRNKKTF